MQPGRPKEFDQDRAVGAAMELFWSQGFEATSLQQLLDHMGIGRSSFYQAFGSKETMFLRAVARYREWLAGMLQERLTAADSGLGFLRAVLGSVADDCDGPAARRGCLVFNSAAEFGQSNPAVAGEISASIDAFSAVFSAAVARAQREGDLAADLDPTLLGRYLVGAMSGLRTLAKAGTAPQELRALAALNLAGLGAQCAPEAAPESSRERSTRRGRRDSQSTRRTS